MTATERHWQELIEKQERGELTMREFCEEHGVSLASLYQWRRRLRGTRKVMKFALIEAAAGKPDGAIELRMATGEALVIHAGADAATLKMVLNVIREQPR